jgi:nitroimidazol reductase NimA-like FMN-containing flavoprotein (pyridoxamine 5'-phosphate oxidase superfamily)
MFSDKSGLEVLSEGESLELLAATSVGRVVYSDRALPFVVPVNFVLDGMDIVIRTSVTSGLVANAPGHIVAFEADWIDPLGKSGWSVVVTGRAQLVDDAVEIDKLDQLELQSWAPAATDLYLRLRADVISGRRVPVGVAQV